MDLAFLWLAIIAFGVIMYVVLDGFDLGIGILSLFVQSEDDKDLIISSIMPVWDGNETWLVFGGAALYGAFPRAFSELLPAAYMPIFIMVLALLLRGVAFEFRLKAANKQPWDYVFFFGSLIAILMQGELLAMFIQGFKLYQGKVIANVAWFNSFGLFCGFALIIGYSLLAADWLIIKTVGNLQEFFYKASYHLQFIIIFCAVIISIWTPLLSTIIMQKWLINIPYLAIFPVVTVYALYRHCSAINKRSELQPFRWAVLVFIMCYFGFTYSSYPYIVPGVTTYKDAAAADSSLIFLTYGALIMLPALLYYTHYSYKVFRGKVVKKLEY